MSVNAMHDPVEDWKLQTWLGWQSESNFRLLSGNDEIMKTWDGERVIV